MKRIFLSLLAIGFFPAIAFSQFLFQDTISLKLNSEVVKTGSDIDSSYEYLDDFRKANENSIMPCNYIPQHNSNITPIKPHSSYPSPYSTFFGYNKQHIQIEHSGEILLVMTNGACNIDCIMDLGLLDKGSEIWHSPDEATKNAFGPRVLHVVLNDTIYGQTGIAFFPELAEGLEIDWESEDIYPNCTLVKTADTTRTNNNEFDIMFEIKDEKVFTILELLDSNDELIRYLFRMHLGGGIYGVYFSRIGSAYKPLGYGNYKLRLIIADSPYICNFNIVE